MLKTTRLDFISHFEGDIEKGAESVKLTPTVIGVCMDKDQGITRVISNEDMIAQKWPRVDKQSRPRFFNSKRTRLNSRGPDKNNQQSIEKFR